MLESFLISIHQLISYCSDTKVVQLKKDDINILKISLKFIVSVVHLNGIKVYNYINIFKKLKIFVFQMSSILKH